jgi:hypothetical protein
MSLVQRLCSSRANGDRLPDTLWKNSLLRLVQALPARVTFTLEAQDMRLLIAVACVALAGVIIAADGTTSSAQQDTPKYTIKDVMKKAHDKKTGLLNKVKAENATDAEAKQLLEMYVALSQNKPPQGDADSWKKKTDALVEGAKLYVDGKKDDAVTKLNGASNCKGCHSMHRG